MNLATATSRPFCEPFHATVSDVGLIEDRSKQLPVNANRSFYKLLRDRVKGDITDDEGNPQTVELIVIDWAHPGNNDFFLAQQMWVSGGMYKRRCDLLGYVNGIPLVFIELKGPHVPLKSAYDDNLKDYKSQSIPHLFHPNAFILLSNGLQTRVGTITSEWEHFFEWKRIDAEEQVQWQTQLAGLKQQLVNATGEHRDAILDKSALMESTDMAVVVSQSQNEVEDLKDKGLDIVPHRQRMLKEDLDDRFKDPDNPLRLVFVCSMWITGFDVPACSTFYIDKPMRNHTLMQAIARANRLASGKIVGLIVDYAGIFRNLQDGLHIYAQPSNPGQLPISDKAVLVEQLKGLLSETETFCMGRGISLNGGW